MKFLVVQYETHVSSYEVEARSKAEAIANILDAQGDLIGCEYLEVNEDIGLPVENNENLVAELNKLSVPVVESYIPCIRSVEEIE